MSIEKDYRSAKVFGGKKFYFETWAKRKADAQKKAGQLRQKGYLVRIVEDTSTGSWIVYGRRQK